MIIQKVKVLDLGGLDKYREHFPVEDKPQGYCSAGARPQQALKPHDYQLKEKYF